MLLVPSVVRTSTSTVVRYVAGWCVELVIRSVAKVLGGVCHCRQSSKYGSLLFLATGFQDKRVQHQIRYEEIIKDKKTLNVLQSELSTSASLDQVKQPFGVVWWTQARR